MSITTLHKEVLSPEVGEVCLRLKEAGARPLIVGGWVRDRLMGLPLETTQDVDVEVFNISFEKLLHVFQQESHVAYPKFGVLRLDCVDISLPRIERCIGPKYNDFCVQIRPDLSFEQVAQRRDFTVNAIGWDPFSEELLDPFHGLNDLEKKLLKPISKAFMEDSYRILRATQLIARFDFNPDQQLLKYGALMSYGKLSPKHIQDTRLILQSAPHKEKALQFLQTIGWQSVAEVVRG